MRLTNHQKYQRQMFIKSSAIKGIGATKTIQKLKEIGLPMRRTDALKLYRTYAGIPQKMDRVKYVRKDYKPSIALYTPQEGYMTLDYRYTIEYETVNKWTGELSLKHSRMSADFPQTIQAIEDDAMGIMAEAEYWEGEIVTRFRIAELEMQV